MQNSREKKEFKSILNELADCHSRISSGNLQNNNFLVW